MKLSTCYTIACLALEVSGVAFDRGLDRFKILQHPDPKKRDPLQNIITWDESSLFIHGERVMIFSGEVHPFRMPVPSLYLDIFEKIKALGLNCVSFYVDWAILEGKPGDYSAEGVLALEPFFDAAKEAGIYLIARPGPYINAEASGGGFPGWLQRLKGRLRTSDNDYLAATDNYVSHVAKTIASAQITNGGPVILYQPENEYTWSSNGVKFPDGDYMQYVIDQARNAGIVVPMISNDAAPNGNNAPGTGVGEVDIYAHDSYSMGSDCAHPSVWPQGSLPTDFRTRHLEQSPSTPYSILEFQAGCWDPWGGVGYDMCAALLNHEYERVFYKNDLSFGVNIFNLYMMYGGTNWCNLGFPAGYTSYDYGAAIEEDRTVAREKYSELKLIANFIKSSPSYLDAIPGDFSSGIFSDTSDVTVTPLVGNHSASSFFVVRQTDETTQKSTKYKLSLPTSIGNVTIPQLGGTLSLHGRDSKIHVTDYNVSGTTILYSTAEIFTWKVFGDKKALIVYGGPEEYHELEILSEDKPAVVEGMASSIKLKTKRISTVLGWTASTTRRIVKIGNLDVIIIDRNSAYDYWVPELSTGKTSSRFNTIANTANSIIVKAGYLVRGASMQGGQLHLSADFNATTTIEVIGAPKQAKTIHVNGKRVLHQVDKSGIWTARIRYQKPSIHIPDLQSLTWKHVDTLPEIQQSYDDSGWTIADHTTTNNTYRGITTPMSLYASDYGFNAGYLLYRGHFVANGKESSLTLHTQGGSAFSSSAWLGEDYLGSWIGNNKYSDDTSTYDLHSLANGETYIITILMDMTGLEENGAAGSDTMKTPRGILDYALSGHEATDITWKLTGNLGGEDYKDRVRGPLNEGGLYAERQGWHQPHPPSQNWATSSIKNGISKAGAGWFTSSFSLNMPTGWDVPLYFTFRNTTTPPPAYRAQLYVNGYQFGKYVNNMGPQTSFPVPQGILNYHGRNWIAISIWALEAGGTTLDGLSLEYRQPIMTTAVDDVQLVETPSYKIRNGAY